MGFFTEISFCTLRYQRLIKTTKLLLKGFNIFRLALFFYLAYGMDNLFAINHLDI